MDEKGEPWFVAKDVALALGLQAKGTGYYHATLDKSEKMILKGEVDRIYYPSLFVGSTSMVTIISESGLYKLVMRSDKPQALAFQNWVTKEVLPAIRKDGAYVMGEEKVRTGEMSEEEFILKAMTMLKGTSLVKTFMADLRT